MTHLTKSHIETFAIELLEKQGYEYICIPNIDRIDKEPYIFVSERI